MDFSWNSLKENVYRSGEIESSTEIRKFKQQPDYSIVDSVGKALAKSVSEKEVNIKIGIMDRMNP